MFGQVAVRTKPVPDWGLKTIAYCLQSGAAAISNFEHFLEDIVKKDPRLDQRSTDKDKELAISCEFFVGHGRTIAQWAHFYQKEKDIDTPP